MSLADFQNPIANSPHVAQQGGAQQNLTSNINQTLSQEQLRQDNEEADSVDETEETADQNAIRDDEESGQQEGQQARRRARNKKSDEEAEPPPINDGIHGGLDLKA